MSSCKSKQHVWVGVMIAAGALLYGGMEVHAQEWEPDELITNVQVTPDVDWEGDDPYRIQTMEVGAEYYTTHDYEIQEMPAELDGIPGLATNRGDEPREYDGEEMYVFDIPIACRVYIAYDQRGTYRDDENYTPPDWITQEYNYTGTEIVVPTSWDEEFPLYEKAHPAGTVRLGGPRAEGFEGGGVGTYFVLVEPLDVDWVVTPPDPVVIVGQGDTATLGPVEVHEEWADEAEIEWYYEAEEEPFGTGETVEIADAAPGHEGIYTVVVDHPVFEPEEFEVELRVGLVTSPPEDQEALLDDTVSFTVTAMEDPQFEWYFEDDDPDEDEPRSTNDHLTIVGVGVEDYGTYILKVSHDDYPDEEWEAELTAPPLVETPPDPAVVLSEGEDVTLGPVLVYASDVYEEYDADDAEYSWIFVPEDQQVSTDPEHTITEAVREDEGTYTVTVTHPRFPFPEVYEVEAIMPPFAPAAGVVGLGVLAGAFGLLGGAYGIRRMRK